MSAIKPRKRNAAATQDAILSAATQNFTEKGYDGAGLREIALDAGVNVALIARYFGSKKGLFEQAILPGLNIDALLEGERSTFGLRAATYIFPESKSSKDHDITLGLIRSISNPDVGPKMSSTIESNVIDRLAEWVGGARAKQRASLILATLLGFDILRRVASVSSLGSMHRDQIVAQLADTLQSYVTPQTE